MAKKKRRRKKTARGRGRPSRVATTLGSLSTEQLMAEIERREDDAAELEARREELMAELVAMDAEIAALTGAATGRKPARRKIARRKTAKKKVTRKKTAKKATRRRKRPVNKTGLVEALHKVLKGKTMSVTEVAAAVQKAGYKTTSANFRVIVNQALINANNKKLFKKVARGQYTAK